MYIENLKKLRKEKELTQNNIAQILKTTQEQYQRYETGKRDLPINHLITLAKFYEKSTDEILGIERRYAN